MFYQKIQEKKWEGLKSENCTAEINQAAEEANMVHLAPKRYEVSFYLM